jgi:hypothetical protein
MISRVTVFSLLLGLMLGVGLRLWSIERKDPCAAYLAGDLKAPSSQWVESGTGLIEVPCNDWLMRQPMRVQILCLLDAVLAAMFVLNALADLRRWLEARRRRPRLE